MNRISGEVLRRRPFILNLKICVSIHSDHRGSEKRSAILVLAERLSS